MEKKQGIFCKVACFRALWGLGDLDSQVFPKFHKKSPSFAPSFKSWEKLGEKLGKQGFGKEWSFIRKKNYKGRCEKRAVAKCDGICKTYDRLQDRMVDILSEDRSVRKIRCNVLMEGTEYVSDIVCTMEDGSTVVYECCYRHLLKRPVTAKLIQQSREYWLRHGVKDEDWRLIVNAEERIDEEGLKCYTKVVTRVANEI